MPGSSTDQSIKLNDPAIQTGVKFLSALFEKTDWVLFRPIETWTEGGKRRSRVIYESIIYHEAHPLNFKYALQFLIKLGAKERANIFFGVCPRLGNGGRFDLAWQIRIVRVLWCDVDDITTEGALERVSKAGLQQPSIVVSSGSGVHFYWLLEAPYLIDDAGDPSPVLKEWVEGRDGKKRPRKYIEEPGSGERLYLDVRANSVELSPKALHIQDIIAGVASAIGGDHTHDLSRLLRVPGSQNRKDERNGRAPRACELIACDQDLRHPLDAFARFADASPQKTERQQIAAVQLPSPRTLSPTKRDKLNSLVTDCAVAPVGTRSEADWRLVCTAIEKGWPKAEVWQAVADVGKFAEAGEAYFERTWSKAESHTREHLYRKAVDGAGARRNGRPMASRSPRAASIDEEADPDDPGHHDHLPVKPEVFLPGGAVSISESASTLGKLLATTGRFFTRGGPVVNLDTDDSGQPTLRVVKPAQLASEIESVAKVVKWANTKEGPVTADAICSEATAKLILYARPFQDQLPPIRLLSPCPVLVQRGADLVQVSGYDRESCVLACGEKVDDDIPVGEAVNYLKELLGDFRFASPSDRSRAIAALVTPALVHGNLLDGDRAPIDLGEADQSQTGKGFRNKLTAALYRQQVHTVTQKRQGVGSLEESFNQKLIQGANFISLDNVRGKIDSPAIESFMTEDTYSARVPFLAEVEIETKRIVLMMTSNKAEITDDLARRSSCTRLLKQADGYEFVEHPEGDVLDHIREHQPLYLGCVFSVVRDWHRRGRPRTQETRHDFKRWARSLDWIVQTIFQSAPLLDGHRETQKRMVNPVLNWVRDVGIVVCNDGYVGKWLRAYQLLDMLANTDVELPGVSETDDLDSDDVRNKVLPSLGRKMGKAFGAEMSLQIDDMFIEKRKAWDDLSRERYEYRFTKVHQP